jgi:hypothetical protein
LHTAFRLNLAVQITAGVQELVQGLRAFSGYVSLAFIAYNAGAGSAAHIATLGRANHRPAGTTDDQWENMCRFGAYLLHQPPTTLRVETGRWQCDRNIPAWFKVVPVRDPQTNLLLISFQYLRSVRECIHPHRPTTPCNATTHGTRQDGSGSIVCQNSRNGVLDKFYNPILLRPSFFKAVQNELPQIAEDNLPLRVLPNGRLVKVQPGSSAP